MLVCIKQVPDTAEIKIDPVTNTLIRDGVPSIVNPFDAYALELALRLREKNSGSVTVLSMGPNQAKEALRECLAIGADRAYLVSDRLFGGSDTLATSYILSEVIRYLAGELVGFDLILCGKQAIDGDTGQVGPELAEHLDIPQLTYVVDMEINAGALRATREGDSHKEVWELPLPALVTVNKTAWEPRYPTLKSKIAARKAEIPTIMSADLGNIAVPRVGLKGSPTKVKRTFTPCLKKNGTIIKAEDCEAAVAEAIRFLSTIHVR